MKIPDNVTSTDQISAAQEAAKKYCYEFIDRQAKVSREYAVELASKGISQVNINQMISEAFLYNLCGVFSAMIGNADVAERLKIKIVEEMKPHILEALDRIKKGQLCFYCKVPHRNFGPGISVMRTLHQEHIEVCSKCRNRALLENCIEVARTPSN